MSEQRAVNVFRETSGLAGYTAGEKQDYLPEGQDPCVQAARILADKTGVEIVHVEEPVIPENIILGEN